MGSVQARQAPGANDLSAGFLRDSQQSKAAKLSNKHIASKHPSKAELNTKNSCHLVEVLMFTPSRKPSEADPRKTEQAVLTHLRGNSQQSGHLTQVELLYI